MKSDNRGTALGATFLIILLLVLFGFTLANLATFDLRVVHRGEERQRAFEAAQAGLSRVTALISSDPTVGLSGEVFTETLTDGSRYRLTFDNTEPQEWCLNNLASLTGQPGYGGRAVPPHHVSLFAHGVSPAGETVLLESLIRLEALPYAVAGTGKVNAIQTQISGAYTASDFNGGITVAGHGYSGSTSADSLVMTGASTVSGDLRSVGGILAGPPVVVAGDVDPNRAPDALPDFNINSFDNSATATVLPGGTFVAQTFTGQVYIDGNAVLTGASVLNDATVFVRGDLTVNTVALAGRGTFFVTGQTSFLTGVNLTGSNKLTLFSEGDISVALPSVFQGVFLTHGNFTGGPGLVVLGAIYANNLGDPSRGNVDLSAGSIVSHVAEFTSFASFWLAIGGEAKPLQVYWNQVR